jgi:YD repeat-containing protein
MQLDVFGNVIRRQLSCCNEQSVTVDDGNNFAMPIEVTKGASGGPQVTTSAEYDFNTSLVISSTDENGHATTIDSRDAALRPTEITYHTGATKTADYDDGDQTVTLTLSYDDGEVESSAVYDGWGRVLEQVDEANNGQVNTTYDAMGRVATRTNPFTAGGSPGPSTSFEYDALGRTTEVTLPDGDTAQTSYNGNEVTLTDQVSRQTKRTVDGLGRLITVTEENDSGSLSQTTSYAYNYLDLLTQVDQGAQQRKFKYDSIGRLLFEKIPEQSATINDGTGTYWSCKYTYTTFNAVATRQDARGVITTYSYDDLNRLGTISYNTVSGVTTAPTVTYVYDYDSTYSTTADGMVVRVNVGSDYQERYTFDGDMRVASTIRTLGSQTYTSSYLYNEANQPKRLTYPSGRGVNTVYDGDGRASGITDQVSSSNYMSSIGYNVAGQVTGLTFGNGVVEGYGYDADRMQLTTQKAGTTSPYTNRMDLTYDYDAASGEMGTGTTAGNSGQLVGISGTINGTTESASFTYDNVGRLVTSNQTTNGASAQRRFEYDR